LHHARHNNTHEYIAVGGKDVLIHNEKRPREYEIEIVAKKGCVFAEIVDNRPL
jgi:hypothetical protein